MVEEDPRQKEKKKNSGKDKYGKKDKTENKGNNQERDKE